MHWEAAKCVYNKAVSKAIFKNRFVVIMRYIHLEKNSELEKKIELAILVIVIIAYIK